MHLVRIPESQQKRHQQDQESERSLLDSKEAILSGDKEVDALKRNMPSSRYTEVSGTKDQVRHREGPRDHSISRPDKGP